LSDHPELLTELGAATYLSMAPGTLRQWRYLGQGPPFIKMGTGRIRYRASDLDAWLRDQTVDPRAVSSS
jgi:predicted DNA-binding transcriptional regulator AlpA